jgi:hypothetical protein
MICYFASLSKGVPGFFVVLAVIVLAIILTVLGVSPLLTAHEIRKNVLVLRQGWYFNMALRLENIAQAEEYDGKTYGLSIKYQRKTGRLYILAIDRRMVSIKLREAIETKVVLMKRVIREVVIDVNDPGAFIKAVNKRRADTYESLRFRDKAGRSRIRI